MHVFKRYKLPICIVILIVLNFVVIKLTKADTKQVIQIEKQELKIISKEEIRQAKFEEVLNNNPSAKKHLGLGIPEVAATAIIICDSFKEEGLTIPTFMAIIEVESNFNPLAIRRARDGVTPESYGLMQVKASTAMPLLSDMGYRWTPDVILEPNINMRIGVSYLMFLHEKFKAFGLEGKNEFHISLLAYNRGTKSVIDSVRHGTAIPLTYLGKVKIASRKWEEAGF